MLAFGLMKTKDEAALMIDIWHFVWRQTIVHEIKCFGNIFYIFKKLQKCLWFEALRLYRAYLIQSEFLLLKIMLEFLSELYNYYFTSPASFTIEEFESKYALLVLLRTTSCYENCCYLSSYIFITNVLLASEPEFSTRASFRVKFVVGLF